MPTTGFDFVSHLETPVEELIRHLAKVQAMIADLYTDLAEAKSQEIDDKAQAYAQTTETTVRGREMARQAHAATSAQKRVEVEGQLEALREERDFLRFLIDTRTRSAVLT